MYGVYQKNRSTKIATSFYICSWALHIKTIVIRAIEYVYCNFNYTTTRPNFVGAGCLARKIRVIRATDRLVFYVLITANRGQAKRSA